MIGAELEQPVDAWAAMKPARDPHEGWSEAETTAFTAEVREVVDTVLRPAFERYKVFLETEILPNGRSADQVGLMHLPGGAECYEGIVRSYTTLPTASSAERHEKGLEQIESVHAEFRVLGKAVFGTDDLAEIFDHLRTDEALMFDTSEEVHAKAENALAAAKAVMGDWFGRVPIADCIVEPIPAFEAKYTTIAYYMRPMEDAGRPGTYYVNTYAPETRPRHEAEVLAYHEAIPGHHLQIAISQELPALPAFRMHGGATAFVEGWGLYTERLSDEMGLYTSDTDRLGMLSFDAWRAARLVVDTGIHAKGWSREQALEYFEKNTPLALNNIDNEVDRYITTPGQALAYKTGQLFIRDLRARAEAELGESFDIKAFHDVVLGGGAVTLPVLEAAVNAWIEDSKPQP
jgi:uncharacterized protein (DUF885 family)